MFKFATLLAFVSGALLAAAQEPAYKGQLLIQPNNNSGMCLQADNSNGAKVTLQACTGNANQQFTFVNGQVKIYGSKCIDVIDGKNVNGQKFQIWDCDANNANPNQKFYYTPWGDKHLAWTDHGKCMDLTDGKLTAGTLPQLWDCSSSNSNQLWDVGYMANNLPQTSENGQSGTNKCGTSSSQSSMCQTAWLNDADDFCLWAPPTVGSVGDKEREVVAWCTKSGRGTRVIPNGTLKGVHFVRTPDYVQVTGVGDLTKINVPAGDFGGELDPHGPDNNGNPVGGLLFGNTFGANRQYHEWTSFISDSQFCFRACTGPNARENCQHIYDEMGCNWNMPANYDSGTFESCKGDNDLPMGIYGTSTFHQGDAVTPAAHPVAPSSSCTAFASVSSAPVKRGYAPQADRKRLTFDAAVTPIA